MMKRPTVSVVACAAFFLALVGGADGGLVSYWEFDGDATAIVGTDGTPMNGPTAATDRNGVPAGALAFDASQNQYVEVPGGGGLDGAYVGTISMWVNWSGEQSDFSSIHYGTVLARQTESPVFTNNLISLTGPDPATAGVAWSSAAAFEQPIGGATPVGDEAWRHVAVTFQPNFIGACELFLDGISQGTAVLEPLSMDSSTPLTIGAWAGVGAYANVTIDQVAIFDDLLGATQIMELATDAKTPLNVGNGVKPAQLPLRGVVATASSELKADPDLGWPYSWANRYANNTTDGVGRTTPYPDGNAGQVDGMWESNGDGTYAGNKLPDPDPEITFDLGTAHYLDKLVVYNYNELNVTSCGVNEVDILVSLDGVAFTSLGTHVFDQAPGNATNPGQEVDLAGIAARYVRFDIQSSHQAPASSAPLVGLNEVDFYGVPVPEPSSLMLLLGGVGMASLLFRKR